jgi:hypothetical protein
MLLNMNFDESWEECFSQFRLLGGLTQNMLRNVKITILND